MHRAWCGRLALLQGRRPDPLLALVMQFDACPGCFSCAAAGCFQEVTRAPAQENAGKVQAAQGGDGG